MITRKQFLRSMAGVGVGLVGVTALAGCDDLQDGELLDADGQPLEPDEDLLATSCTPNAQISSNHGHRVAVPASHVVAGVERTYSIQGASSHRHFITVTAAMFASLRAGNSVSVVSGGTSHVHTVTIGCVPFCTRTVQISANHGHALVVPFYHVAQGVPRQYSIQGTSSHRHFINLTGANFATLRTGSPVTVESGGVSHTHSVTITCIPPVVACTPTPAFSSNHGHLLAVTAADVSAGFDREYNVMGTASHPHSVVVTAAMFEMLAQNITVTTTTTGGNHMHTVTITCPAAGAGSLLLPG